MAFFVTGYPRSRTAWLAAALTTNDSLCQHEGLLLGVDRLKEWLSSEGAFGDSDSGLLIPAGMRILEAFPNAPVVIVDRNRKEALLSWHRFMGNKIDFETLEKIMAILDENLAIVKATRDPLIVPFEEVGNAGTGALICEHLGIDNFNPSRWELLDELNIQQKGP